MKSNFLFIGALFLFFAFSTSSCSDDDGDNGGGTAAAGTVKANVDGSNFESQSMTSSLTLVDGGGSTTMLITATDLEGRNLTLQVIGYNGEGSYDIGGNNTILVNATWVEVDVNNPSNVQTYISPYDGDAVRGFIEIDSDSGDNMQGTFEFTAGDNMGGTGVVDITSGSFNLDY